MRSRGQTGGSAMETRDERAALRERFRQARTAKNLTQQQVADAAGVSLATVNNFERGHSVPQYAKLNDGGALWMR